MKFPARTYDNWEACATLMPHAKLLLDYHYTSESSLLGHSSLLGMVVKYSMTQGQLGGAYERAKESYAENLKLLGEKHPQTLSSMDEVALALHWQGKYDEAEQIYRDELALQEGGSGEGTLRSIMPDLANVLTMQHKYEEAEKMLRERLRVRETGLGKTHQRTLMNRLGLVFVLGRQHKYEEAEQLQRQGLELREAMS